MFVKKNIIKNCQLQFVAIIHIIEFIKIPISKSLTLCISLLEFDGVKSYKIIYIFNILNNVIYMTLCNLLEEATSSMYTVVMHKKVPEEHD